MAAVCAELPPANRQFGKQENHIDYEIYRIEHGVALTFANYQPSYQLKKFNGYFG